jgi:hypothetical protein
MRLTASPVVLTLYQHSEVWNTETAVLINQIETYASVDAPLDTSPCLDFAVIRGTAALALIRFWRKPLSPICANADGTIVRGFETETNHCIRKGMCGNPAGVIQSFDLSNWK